MNDSKITATWHPSNGRPATAAPVNTLRDTRPLAERLGWNPSMQRHVDRQLGRTATERRTLARMAAKTPLIGAPPVLDPAPETKAADATTTLMMVRALLDAGATGIEVAEKLGVHLRTARKWIAKARHGWVAGGATDDIEPPASMAEAAGRLFGALGREIAYIEAAGAGGHSDTLARLVRAMIKLDAIMPEQAADTNAPIDHDAWRRRLAAKIAEFAADEE